MKLQEFRKRWIDSCDPATESSIDDSGLEGVGERRPTTKQPSVRQPVRLRPKYVPEPDSDLHREGIRRALSRAMIAVAVFFVALVVLGVILDYLPAYLRTYVYDR